VLFRSPPPEFGPTGSLPPEFAFGWLIQEEYFLHQNAPPVLVLYTRPHVDLHSDSHADAIVKLIRTTNPPAELATARKWLLKNLGSPSLQYAEGRQLGSLSGTSLYGIPGGYGTPGTPEHDRQVVRRQVERNATVTASSLTDTQALLLALERLYDRVELRRIKHSVLWQRVDAFRIPPGVTRKWTKKVAFGISQSDAADLSASLGLGGGVLSLGQLSMQVSKRLSQSVSLSTQRESTEELTLTNGSKAGYRVYAIWQQLPVIEVSYLHLTLEGLAPAWGRVSRVSLRQQHTLEVTYTDLAKK